MGGVINLFWQVVDKDAVYAVDKKTKSPQIFDGKAAKVYFAHLLKRSPPNQKPLTNSEENVSQNPEIPAETPYSPDEVNGISNDNSPEVQQLSNLQENLSDDSNVSINSSVTTMKRSLNDSSTEIPIKVQKEQ